MLKTFCLIFLTASCFGSGIPHGHIDSSGFESEKLVASDQVEDPQKIAESLPVSLAGDLAVQPLQQSGKGELESTPDSYWPQFRGVQACGIGSGNPPIEWNVETGENILWKRKLDGLAHSSPIVHGNHVFVTTAVNERGNEQAIQTGFLQGTGQSADDSGNWRWQIACFDANTGIEIWRRTVANRKPATKRHLKATHANCTPATDGTHIVAFFGSEGLYCLDFEGKLLWQKDFGKLHSGSYRSTDLEWGFASSPVIHEGKVIVQCDCLNTAFVAILDVTNGNEIHRIPRNDVATWSTPLVMETETETQLICNGYRQMASYNFETGEQIWTLSGGGDVPVPAPLTAHGLVFLSNGHGRQSAYAISPSARGDITPDGSDSDELPDGLVWYEPRGGAYIPTPIVVDDYLYTCSSRGVLAVRDAKTGELVYQQRVGGQYSASAVATKDQLYFCGEDGTVNVVKTGVDYELLAKNDMQETVFATPAIVGDQILIRTANHLYAIGRSTE
ncbi:MAG: PQQ-binding-like beta-propeller repeat protein [Pirellulales bacterium]|nr:PQQ-binding-like beta-propeller repeat protein [Pirellulales bacterium]